MLRIIRRWALVPAAFIVSLTIVVAIAATLAPRTATPASGAGDCTTDPALDSEELAFLTLINNYRAENGRGPLAASFTLSKAAQWKSNDMGVNRYFAHDDLDRTWVERIRDCGYSYSTYIGENIAAGISGAQAAFDLWKNSPGHNSNMLGSNYTAIGIGRAYVAGSPYGWYWSTEFGGHSDGWIGSTPTATPTPTRTITPVPPTATPTATAVPDTTPPEASITSPSNGATVSATVPFHATATDAGGIHKVRFWVDGVYLGYDSAAPYTRSLPTSAYPNGRKTLKIQALDWAGNSTVRTITVTVLNPDSTPPAATITSPASGANVSSTVTVSANATDTQGMQKVRFWIDGTYLGYDGEAPYTSSWNTTTFTNGRKTLKIEALDWAGNSTVRTITVTVLNPDSTPPAASIASPANDATVSGTITISANASDTQGMQKVRFWVDGTYLGYDSTAPWTRSWNSASATNGPHTIRIEAIDWANNATEATITVNVAN